ncbi:MAG: methylmalonyl-CoA mutase, partial [candidate division Zixibacteria bacterium]|nr:methylmalonyl-CoA mutase [candidate division Zixibacteria bacterium]
MNLDKSDKETTSGIKIPVVAEKVDSDNKQTRPGEYPYTRGIYKNMYRGRFWTMRQYAGFGTAEETNNRFRYLLKNGQTGLSVAFDLATQIGYDSDNPMAHGEVGRTGVAIDSLADMEQLFDKIPLGEVSTSMTINSTAVILLAMYITVAKKQGVASKDISGTIQNDILKEFIARGTYIFPPEPSMRIITDIFAYAGKHLPRFNTISISGYHIREAGATAVQEIAFTLSDAIAYVKGALKAGLDIDAFAPRLSFFFASHSNLFEEVAKFRAARKIWAKIVKEQFGAKNEKSLLLRFHTQTGGSTLTAQQPENNIVRTAMQALAAVLGGTQSLHTNAYDEALALPTEKSAEIALRTQQILGFESGITDSADPLGGSYLLEHLTSEIEKKTIDLMEIIKNHGGAIKCVENGYFKTEIANSAYKYQKAIESDETTIIGVNKFKSSLDTVPSEILTVDPSLEQKQVEKLSNLKKTRNNEKVLQCLNKIKNTAKEKTNIVVPVIEAVEEYATIGEIADCLREIYGEY